MVNLAKVILKLTHRIRKSKRKIKKMSNSDKKPAISQVKVNFCGSAIKKKLSQKRRFQCQKSCPNPSTATSFYVDIYQRTVIAKNIPKIPLPADKNYASWL
jgi:hypothetical protein